jgi:DNA-binding PadR family transcriptional regulator
MLQRLTVYEIKRIIKKNFWGICSDSTGSIQAGIKKLLTAEMITYSEYVEKSVNKKRYSITDKGRKELLQWVQTPADMSGSTNMELGKLMFMGLVPAEKHTMLIDEIIAHAENELSLHLELQATLNLPKGIETAIAYLEKDPEYRAGIQNATQNTDNYENIKNIGHYQMLTLQYGIDLIKFEIEWFKKLKGRSTTT